MSDSPNKTTSFADIASFRVHTYLPHAYVGL